MNRTTRIRTLAAVLAAVAALALSACDDSTGKPAASASKPAKTVDPSKAAKDLADAREAAGLPPSVAPAARAAFLDGLNAIDPDIVHGKDDKAVSRGLDSCSSIKNFPGDRAKQVKLIGMRFSSPTHPEGRDTATATKIRDLAHKHICPSF
jgi:hypothetical protein